jgi:hypothetical protein
MTWFLGWETRICRPERIFEELEPRVVLDASVDVSDHHDSAVHDIAHHHLSDQALHLDGPVDGHEAADPDFNVVLISDALPEQDMLLNAASRHAQVLVFDAARDNLDTINVRLHDMVDSSGRTIDHLAVLDHAKAGEWRIGKDRFNLFSLPEHRASFENLGSVLSDHAQIQLYGCELAGSPMGRALVDRIALYTHADVFASFDKVGGGSRHHDATPSDVGASVMEPVTQSMETAAPHQPAADAPPVLTPAKPAFLNLGTAKLVQLGHSFAVDDTHPEQFIAATVTYDSQPASRAGLRNLTLHIPSGSSATIEPPTHGNHAWTIAGSVEDVNRVLGTMRASTSAHYTGESHVTVATVDPASHEPISSQTLTIPFLPASGHEHVSHTASPESVKHGAALEHVPLSSVESPFPDQTFQPGDPPVVAIDAESMTVDGDVRQTIPEIKVFDPGSQFVDVVLSAAKGSLSAPNPLPYPGVEVRGNNGIDEPVIRLSGFFNVLNETLKEVTYQPAQGYIGPDMLTVQVQGRGGYTNEMAAVHAVEKTLPIEVVKP